MILIPALGAVIAYLGVQFWGGEADPEDIDTALISLVTVNAVVVGLVYVTMRSAGSVLTGGPESESFLMTTIVMALVSVGGVLAAIVHLAWHPQWESSVFVIWSPLPITAAALVYAPLTVPFLAIQERRAMREGTSKGVQKALADLQEVSDEESGRPTVDASDNTLDSRARVRVRAPEFSTEFSIADGVPQFEGDLFDRGSAVQGFCNILFAIEAPAVFSVEAEWGQGKSAFLEMCAVLMESDEFAEKSVEVARFNAWTQNYHNDPLKDIVAAITSRDSDTNAERDIDRAETGAVRGKDIEILLRRQASIAVSGGLLPDATFADRESSSSDGSTFRDVLETYVAANCRSRLVVFVDEMDRCQPRYAMGVLERVRHLFDVPGVVVVIAVNPNALNHAVAALHGPQQVDGDYLKRLIDQRMMLPARPQKATAEFVDHVCESVRLPESFARGCASRAMLDVLLDASGTSLRDIEQTVYHVAVVVASLPRPIAVSLNPPWVWEQTALAMMTLRSRNKEAYAAFVADRAVPQLVHAIESLKGQAPLSVTMQALLLFATHGPVDEPIEERIWSHGSIFAGGHDEGAKNVKRELAWLNSEVGTERPDIVQLSSIIEMATYEPPHFPESPTQGSSSPTPDSPR